MTTSTDSAWTCNLGSDWDYLGPFPIHAREQHLLSPSYPLDLSQPIDYDAKWPSSYADDGLVGWERTSAHDGQIKISFPRVRWSNLRATEGWAALQHHVILKTTLLLTPPSEGNASSGPHFLHQILVDLKQGSYFALKPKDAPANFVPRWFAGNIYDLERALPTCIDLSGETTKGPLEYELYVSGDYEIRLFGDPVVSGVEVPTISISLSVRWQDMSSPFIQHEDQHIICDFVDGFAFGNIVGLGVQSLLGSWTVKDVSVIGADAASTVTAKIRSQSFKIAPLQTRIIPITLEQTAPFEGTDLTFKLVAVSDYGQTKTLFITLPVNHHTSASATEGQVFKGSFLFASSSPSLFLAMPPISKDEAPLPPIVALHGAGVDIISMDFWMKFQPRNYRSWIIAPTGRTSWGLDWHGPSVIDAFSAVVGLSAIVCNRPTFPSSWRFPHDTKVLVLGHSNGGQGTWHLAGRFPDKVIGIIPAAGYLKSQAYVSLAMGRGNHYVDPMLRAILETSLTPDDNDLHLSNLVDTPILSIHGGDDENVPVWHTREAFSVVKCWNPSAKIIYHEDPGKIHTYPTVFRNPTVQQFLDNALESHKSLKQSESFTLTVANPRESGSLHGWQIRQLLSPGRLGRLRVEKVNDFTFKVSPVNVHTFSILGKDKPTRLIVDGQAIDIQSSDVTQPCVRISKELDGWKVTSSLSPVQYPPGRLQGILTSPGPIFIVIAEDYYEHNLSVAQRIAHTLHVHHRIDTEIIKEHAALERTATATWAPGNIVFIGPTTSIFGSTVLSKNRTPVRLVDGTFRVMGQAFNKKDQAILFTHPHPSSVAPESFLLFVFYNRPSALERAIRMFPYRTGVVGPDWVVTGEKMDSFAAGGIEAAGLWGRDWTFNESMSWMSQ